MPEGGAQVSAFPSLHLCHISVYLMKDEFDDQLSWPLKGILTLLQPLNEKITLRGSNPKIGSSIIWHRAHSHLTLLIGEVSVKL